LSDKIDFLTLEIQPNLFRAAIINESNEIINFIEHIFPNRVLENNIQIIKNVLEEKNFIPSDQFKQAYVTVNENNYREKIITLNVPPTEDFNDALTNKLTNQFFYDSDTHLIKYKILNEKKNIKGYLEYLIAILIIKKDAFYKFKVLIEKIGIKNVEFLTHAIAISSFHNQNILGAMDKVEALLNIENEKTELIVMQNKLIIFQKTILFGINNIENELSFSTMSPNQIKVFLKETDLMKLKDNSEHNLLLNSLDNLINELNRAFHQCLNLDPTFKLSKLFLFGEDKNVLNLDKYLKTKLNIKIEPIQLNSPNALYVLNKFSSDQLNLPKYTLVTGLAICLKKKISLIKLDSFNKPQSKKAIFRNLKASLYKTKFSKKISQTVFHGAILAVIFISSFAYSQILQHKIDRNKPKIDQLKTELNQLKLEFTK